MLFRHLAIILAALACTACASGQTSRTTSADDELAPKSVAPAPKRVAVPEYLAFLDELTQSIESEKPRVFNARELREYRRIESELRASLAGVENIDQLNHEQQIKVFNLHEELQAVFIGDPKYQVICRREQTVGTHFRRTSCMTVQEFRSYQDGGQAVLRGAWPTMTPPAN